MMSPIRDALLIVLAAVAGVAALQSGAAEAGPYAWGSFLAVAVGLAAMATWDAAHARRVLLVGDPRSARVPGLETSLSYGAFAVRRCPGPTARSCPVDAGEPCPYADHLAAGLVLGSADAHPDPPCERALGIPVLYVDTGRSGELVIRGRSTPDSGGTPEEDITQAIGELVTTST